MTDERPVFLHHDTHEIVDASVFGEKSKVYETPSGDELLMLEPREQFDPAIIGVAERFHDRFVLYSKRKVLEALAQDFDYDGEDEDEPEDPSLAALEHYEYNIVGGWVGEHTPGFLDDTEDIHAEVATDAAFTSSPFPGLEVPFMVQAYLAMWVPGRGWLMTRRGVSHFPREPLEPGEPTELTALIWEIRLGYRALLHKLEQEGISRDDSSDRG